jgi:hypothetical protein
VSNTSDRGRPALRIEGIEPVSLNATGTFGGLMVVAIGNHVAVRPELDSDVLLDQRVGSRTALSD